MSLRPFGAGLWAPLLVVMVGCEGAYEVDEQTQGGLNDPSDPTPVPTPWPEGHLQVSPPALDFGPVVVGCQSIVNLRVRNVGLKAVKIFSVGFASGASDEVRVDSVQRSLEPYDTFDLPVAYAPENAGGDAATLLINSDAPGQTSLDVPVSGRDAPGGEGFDSWIQGPAIPTDFLLILDTSGSMNDNIASVVANFEGFVATLQGQGVDYHLGFISTDMTDEGNLQGTYGPEGLPWITADMGQEGVDAFKTSMLEASTGSRGEERGLDSMAAALSDEKLSTVHAGFLREDARLVVTVFSDEDDHSASSVDKYATFFGTLKADPTLLSFSSIVALPASCPSVDQCSSSCAAEAGFRYLEMTEIFGGYTDEVCAGSYSQMMASLGAYGVKLQDTFALTQQAEPSYPFEVTVDGILVEESYAAGYTYLPDANSLYFAKEVVPPALAEIVARYTTVQTCP